MNKCPKIKVSAILVAMSFMGLNALATEAPDISAPVACSQAADNIRDIQNQQYRLKKDQDPKTLYQLQAEYDAALSEASILKELNRLNSQMHAALSPAGDPIRSIVNHINRVTAPENLQVLKNMAAVDMLFKDLSDESGLKLVDKDGKSNNVTIEDIQTACAGKTDKVLCRVASNPGDPTRPLVDSFLLALNADHTQDSTERKNKINAYREVLRNDFSPAADFEGIYREANALKESVDSPAFASIERVESLGQADNADILKLKQVRCCSYENDNQVHADSMCSALAGFSLSSCNEYKKDLNQTYDRVISNFSNYESRTYEALNYNFKDIDVMDKVSQRAEIELPKRTLFSNFFNSIGIGRSDETRQNNKVNDVSNKINQSNGQVNATKMIDDLASSITCQLKTLYRRGKIGHDQSDFIRDVSISHDSALENNSVAEQINKKICAIAAKVDPSQTGCTSESATRDRFVKIEDGKIVVANKDLLEKIFDPKNNLALEQDIASAQANIAQLKAKIDAIQNGRQYQYLDQIKSFLAWDMKSRCSNKDVKDVSIVTCPQAQFDLKIDYLVSDVMSATDKLIAEIDPETMAKRDLSGATLAQKRIILGNMNGACQGLKDQQDQSSASYSAIIKNACARISKVNSAASQTTASERNATIRERYGSINADGQPVRINSTGKDIMTGLAHGLPAAANTVINPFFSGIALRNSLPAQEQYLKQMKLNQYAQDWMYNYYSSNAFYSMPYGYGYSPYYLSQPVNYSSGFDFNQNGISSVP